MATLRDIRRRIISIKNTQEITRAMQMVAAAKLRRAQERVIKAKSFARKMEEVLSSLALRTSPELHPLLAQREVKKVEIVVLTSDRGLCGGFNLNIIQKTENLIRQFKGEEKEASLLIVGRKGRDYFQRRGAEIRKAYVQMGDRVDYGMAEEIGKEVMAAYTLPLYDSAYLLYNEFRSAIRQEIKIKKLLPLTPLEAGPEVLTTEYIFEPSAPELLAWLLPHYVKVQTFQALLESGASEQVARMTAMDSATNNATEMISQLTLKYNRARQEAITKELMDIVGGAEALR